MNSRENSAYPLFITLMEAVRRVASTVTSCQNITEFIKRSNNCLNWDSYDLISVFALLGALRSCDAIKFIQSGVRERVLAPTLLAVFVNH